MTFGEMPEITQLISSSIGSAFSVWMVASCIGDKAFVKSTGIDGTQSIQTKAQLFLSVMILLTQLLILFTSIYMILSHEQNQPHVWEDDLSAYRGVAISLMLTTKAVYMRWSRIQIWEAERKEAETKEAERKAAEVKASQIELEAVSKPG